MLKTAFVSNGKIEFINGKDSVPTTSEVQRNTTINRIGTPEVPASFEVEFRVYSTFDVDGRECEPYISITVPVSTKDKKVEFLEIEDQAVAGLAPMLREIADALDKQMEELNSAPGRSATGSPE